MKEEHESLKTDEVGSITPRFIVETLLPIVKDEFVAKCRADRAGIKITFCNGQKFHITVNEIK